MANTPYRWSLVIICTILVAALAYGIMNIQDERETDRRIREAVHDFPQSVSQSEEQSSYNHRLVQKANTGLTDTHQNGQ